MRGGGLVEIVKRKQPVSGHRAGSLELPLPARLAKVTYGIRGRLHAAAELLERSGSAVLDLSLGNPAAFGFRAPAQIVEEVAARLEMAQGYTPAKGLLSAREAVAAYAASQGTATVAAEDVYLGNGVSDLILTSLQALLDHGDEVLVPMPDYPVWTAAVRLAGGVVSHYPCNESEAWLPDIEAMEAQVTPRTKALVLINPNNPTGAVYPRATLEAIMEVARRHHLVVLSDEIYDQILYDGLTHIASASLAPDLVCLTFNGLSKAYLLTGYRSGWLAVTGPRARTTSLRAGLDVLAAMRLGANAPGQIALEAALTGSHGPAALVLPGGRLSAQRDAAVNALSGVPGVTCVRPGGAFYLFPRLDPSVWRSHDDEKLLLEVLHQRGVLYTPGTAFHWPRPDHFRVVTLATVDQLRHAAQQLRDHGTMRGAGHLPTGELYRARTVRRTA
jgi:alanine-synthesizing transaminase